MPEAKKTPKAKVAKPNVVKAKPVAKAKAKAKVARPAPKAEEKKPEVKAPIAEKPAKKTRSYSRKPKGSLVAYENLLKHEAELEKARKAAKTELKGEYEKFLKEADEVKTKYQKLFNESISSAPKDKANVKAKPTGAKKNGWKSFSLDQVQSFIDQTSEGTKVKIPGKNAIGVKKIQEAYDKATNKDAESVLELLK
jgi:hypothetical protein